VLPDTTQFSRDGGFAWDTSQATRAEVATHQGQGAG
jgi:hypothetical protein